MLAKRAKYPSIDMEQIKSAQQGAAAKAIRVIFATAVKKDMANLLMGANVIAAKNPRISICR